MTAQETIPYCQIHLDFHTSKYIEGVGERFNADEFIRTLKGAHVHSLNLFTKCHHGMFYYPTKLGAMHPHLKFDLFGAQIKACRENGIRAVAYTCAAWCEDWADRHPEWLVVDPNGVLGACPPFACGPTRWRSLCIGNPEYREQLMAELREVYDLYHPDGFWIDIVLGKKCVCAHCQKEMRDWGLNPENPDDVTRHDMLLEIDFCRTFYTYLKGIDGKLEIYFNNHPYKLDDARDMAVSSVEKRKYFSFIDIESLPSEEWGYAHFPVAVNYVNHESTEICMMNGKFHGSWGDFGSLRNLEAMEYECFRAIANGAKICMGDQLHPSGRLEPAVYARIGHVFASVEQKEPWLKGSRKVREVAVLIPSAALEGDANRGGLIEEAAYRMLSELHIPFDFVNAREPLDGYRVVILPDTIRLDGELCERLNRFTRGGGRILATGQSGLMRDRDEFGLEGMGCKYEAPSLCDVRYIRFDDACFDALPQMDHVVYAGGERVTATGGQVLAGMVDPYFNRTYDRYCSHRQTPPKPQCSGDPAIVEGDAVTYVAAPLFQVYAARRYRVYRDIVSVLLSRLYARPLLISDLPAITEVTVRALPDSIIVHLLNYVIERKCRTLDTIEERFTVHSATLALRCNCAPASVRLVPQGSELPWEYVDGYARIALRDISGHTMIEVTAQT